MIVIRAVFKFHYLHLLKNRIHIIYKKVTKSTMSILARKTCLRGWKSEYQGYLMAGYHAHASGTKYTCMDSHPDTLSGGHTSKGGRLFYPVEARCGSLKCPPYVEGRELTCVVCSKE